jgi:hypothetical protein
MLSNFSFVNADAQVASVDIVISPGASVIGASVLVFILGRLVHVNIGG